MTTAAPAPAQLNDLQNIYLCHSGDAWREFLGKGERGEKENTMRTPENIFGNAFQFLQLKKKY